ncbi:MAG: ATP-binding domain-containing protein [Alphaproteobacteria bacterium]|nr:ATP-binding domain-containing protein [Alphaproteobacteria bacterium]
MSVAEHPIVREEETHLARVRTHLLENPVTIGASERELVGEIQRLQVELGQAKAEDMGAILQQFDQLNALLGQLRRGRSNEDPDPDCPYFAHMELDEEGRRRDLFLGKVSRIERGLRIIDWRNAPIARLFYRYHEGEEYAEELGDRIHEGVLLSRRTLSIARGRLERVDCPQGVFHRADDGAWRRQAPTSVQLAGGAGTALLTHRHGSRRTMGGRPDQLRADKHLPDIAALIDPEQFELISRPQSGLVVIRGIAGSGKTTVALHRVAWLAFQDPRRFAPERMIVVVWGRAMRDYISKVLPSLGVEGVMVRTWADWSRELVKRHYPFLPRRQAEDTPEIVTRMKLHPAMLEVMERQLQTMSNPPNAQGALDDFLGMFMDLPRLKRLLIGRDPGSFTEADLDRAWTWLSRQRDGLRAWVEGDREEQVELDAEDDALLLRLWQRRVGPLRGKGRRPLRYGHMVVDEVQDLSPTEVRVLMETLDKGRSMTLAGDTQQHIIASSGFSSWGSFFGDTGLAGTEVSTLRVSYRSTHEITTLARRVLGDLAEDDVPPVTTRPGAPVELFQFTDHGGCVAFLGDALRQLLQREPLASVAVITPDPTLSALYAQGLADAEVPRLRRVVEQTFAFAPGVEVVEVEEVKGLEFDYVVLIEVSARYYPDDAHARRLLHVGATRAAHQLWLTAVGSPSPILRGLGG